MSTDYPDPPPPAETTDPGFKQRNQKVGANDEFTLPDIVQIISPTHTTWVGRYTQEGWVRGNFLARGIAGTAVQWFVFLAEIGRAYPLPSYSIALILLTTVDEKFSEEPIMSNTIKYMMTSYDPKAAEMIFAPKAAAGDPVKAAGRMATEEATKAYLESPEYQDLKAEIALDVQMQVRRQAYAAAGMTVEVKALDEEIAASRAEKRAEHEREKEAKPIEVPPIEEAPPIEEVPAAVPPSVESPGPAAPVEELPADPAELAPLLP